MQPFAACKGVWAHSKETLYLPWVDHYRLPVKFFPATVLARTSVQIFSISRAESLTLASKAEISLIKDSICPSVFAFSSNRQENTDCHAISLEST